MEIHGKKIAVTKNDDSEETGFQLFENKAMEWNFREINLHFCLSTTEEKANYFLESGNPNLLLWSQNLKQACVVLKIIAQSLCD